MANALVSIVIPVYNRERLVRDAIESALAQTYRNIEIVVIDNHSTDDTHAVMQEYTQRNARVRCFQNDRNIGPVRNWLRGVELSTGEYTKILFSDDTLEPQAIQRYMDGMHGRDNVGVVFSSVMYRGVKGTTVLYREGKERKIRTEDFLYDYAIMSPEHWTTPYSPGAAFFRRRDLVEAITLNIPNRIGIDCDSFGSGNDALMYWRCAEKYPYVYYVPEPLCSFRPATVGNRNLSYALGDLGRGWGQVFACEQAAFAYFLATSCLPEKLRRKLQAALYVANFFSFSPQRRRQGGEEFARLFPQGYDCWAFEYSWPALIALAMQRSAAARYLTMTKNALYRAGGRVAPAWLRAYARSRRGV